MVTCCIYISFKEKENNFIRNYKKTGNACGRNKPSALPVMKGYCGMNTSF